MSRSGYIDDADSTWDLIRWRGAVKSAMKGKRGRAFLLEMLTAMDAMPQKRLIADELKRTKVNANHWEDLVSFSHWGMFPAPGLCAIGTVGERRGLDMSKIDPEDYCTVANQFNIALAMAQEIVYVNDEMGPYRETPEERFARV